MRYKLHLCLLALFIHTPLNATEKPDNFGQKLGSGQPFLLEQMDFLSNEYQIGDEWGKKPVTAQEIDGLPQLAHIAYGTARVGGATGFYLGKFGDRYVMATNHHVCAAVRSCKPGATVVFPLLHKSFRVESFYGSWPEIDLALFAISVGPDDETVLAKATNPYAFEVPIKQGSPLATLGFGVAENPSRQLVGAWDGDCKVFSADNDYRLLADPDSVNPGPYKAWSFSIGCSVSHGDSGSAIIDLPSGRVIGIIWTGKIPKNEKVQNSAYLEEMLANQSPEIWTELSFAVPSAKIREKLTSLLANKPTDTAFGQVLTAILGR